MQVKCQSFSHSKWQSCLPFTYHHLTSSFAEPSRVTWTFSSVNLAARAAAQVLPSMAKTWLAPSSAQSLAKGAYAPHPTSNTMASSPRTALTQSPCAFPTANVWTSRCSNVAQTRVIMYISDYPPFFLHPSMCSSNIFHMYTNIYIYFIIFLVTLESLEALHSHQSQDVLWSCSSWWISGSPVETRWISLHRWPSWHSSADCSLHSETLRNL